MRRKDVLNLGNSLGSDETAPVAEAIAGDGAMDLTAGAPVAEAEPLRDGRDPAEPSLLLGAQDIDADAALLRTLHDAGTEYTMIGPVYNLRLGRDAIGRVMQLFQKELKVPVRKRVRAAYVPNGASSTAEALNAFVAAVPLTDFMEHLEHRWIRDAMSDNWLFSVFQPIVEARTGQVVAQEALMRAIDPESERLLGADAIIRAARSMGLLHSLDHQARRMAIESASIHVPAPTRVFINFLPITVEDPDVCLRSTLNAAKEFGVALSRLVFEVVETDDMPEMPQLKRIFNYYRSRGIGTAIDGMGGQQANVDYIAHLEPDFVKLDRSLIVRALDDVSARTQIDAIVKVARMHHATVIGEGIETMAEWAICEAAGMDCVQGYLFARPACPPSEVELPLGFGKSAA